MRLERLFAGFVMFTLVACDVEDSEMMPDEVSIELQDLTDVEKSGEYLAPDDGSRELEPPHSALTSVVADTALSEVAGCHFYVDSNFGGATIWMGRKTAAADLHAHGMGDKISAVRLRGGATARIWIDKNYGGSSWDITSDVATLHAAQWGNLGDNASSVDCY